MIRPNMLLRRILQLDAIASMAMALPMAFASDTIARLLNLPEGLVLKCGLFLIVYAALVGWLSARAELPRALLLLVVIGNAAWAVGSLILLLSPLIAPNLAGVVLVTAQAIAVGLFAALQYVGMRQSTPMQLA